jgi:hypothetical protein
MVAVGVCAIAEGHTWSVVSRRWLSLYRDTPPRPQYIRTGHHPRVERWKSNLAAGVGVGVDQVGSGGGIKLECCRALATS